MNSNSQSNYSIHENAGFTLIEMLISMAVLIFISFGIFQATTETYRLRDILSTEGDFYNGIRLAMDLIQKDVNSIYSPTLMSPNPKASSPPGTPGFTPPTNSAETTIDRETQNLLSGELGQTTKFWLGATDKTGIRGTHFIGTSNKISFVAISHLRIYKDSPESEFSKITYELGSDPSPNAIPGTKVLIKTEDSNAFSDDDLKDVGLSHSYKLLQGVTELKFTYYKRDGNTWKTYTSWDNEKEEVAKTFPDIIEVSISVTGPSRLSFQGTYKLRPEAPLRGLNPST